MLSILRSILIFSFIFDAFQNEIIETSYGSLKGEQLETIQGRKYHVFRKIPFAKPPLGELRFQPPQPPESWNGIRNAVETTPLCIQNTDYTGIGLKTSGDEDCLYLDVHKPSMVKQKPLPVIVFIHGGRQLSVGNAFAIPEYFMDYEVIFVNIQYRLHVFGFASLGDEVLPGNLGLKDQVAALQYVQANIASFGGNPQSVTLMGHSTGAGNAVLHMFSGLSAGLFHRVIALGGNHLMPTFFKNTESVKRATLDLANRVCCPTSSSQKLIQCFQTVPADHLIKEYEKLFLHTLEPVVIFSAVAEGNTSNSFVVGYPNHVVNNVPLLIGCNYREGSFKMSAMLHDDKTFDFWKHDLKRLFPLSFNYGEWMSEEEAARVSDILFKSYFEQDHLELDQIEEITDLFSDGTFTMNVLETANTHPNVVYLYLFDHDSEFWMPQMYNMSRSIYTKKTIPHADELYMLFHLTGFPKPKITPGTDDFKVSQRMLQYLVNFAHKGNPNTHEQQLWKPAIPEQLQYLNISTFQDQMQQGYRMEYYRLWRSLNAIRPKSSKQIVSNDEL